MTVPRPRLACVAGILLALSSGASAVADPAHRAARPRRLAAVSVPAPWTLTTAPHPVAEGQVTKLMVLVIENRSYDQMTRQMPYVFGLAQKYGYATDYHAIRHPSLPNYLAIAGGRSYGVADDNAPAYHTASGPSVFGDAIRAGKTATIYNEGMTGPCALEAGGDRYAVKHNAWAYFADERDLCAEHDTSMARLDRDIDAGTLPDAGEIIPDLCHDAHDYTPGCSLGEADSWLADVVGLLLAGPDFASGHLAVVITADEDSGRDANQILTTVYHPSQHHHVVTTPLTHYSLSRLFSQVLGTTPRHHAADAPDMAEAFGLSVAGR